MSRRWLGCAALLALALLPHPAQAQLGGITKKARQTAAQAAGVPSTDQPARMAGPEVTPAVVDNLLKGLKAEAAASEQQAAAERQRQAREQAGRDAANRQSSCYEDKKESDPAWPEIQRLQNEGSAAADKGDYNKAAEIAQRMNTLMTEMTARIQAACGQPAQAQATSAQATPDQQAIQQANVNPGTAGAQAAGMSAQDYAQLKELVFTHLQSPKKAGLAPAEQQAIDAKKKDLKERLHAVGIG